MMALLVCWTVCCASFGIGVHIGMYRLSWIDTRHNVREEMEYEQATVHLP